MSLWLNSLTNYIRFVIFYEGQNFKPFSCLIFPYLNGFQNMIQNGTSRFHNFRCWTPILKCDTSMSLWLNSLICYIKIFIFYEDQNFNPFSYSIFPYFQQEPKTTLLNSITFVVGPQFWCAIPQWVWLNFLIFYIKIFMFNEGQKFNPFSCSIFPYLNGFQNMIQNGTSKFHNFRCWTPILKWDTSMNLWLNFLICYIKIFIFYGWGSCFVNKLRMCHMHTSINAFPVSYAKVYLFWSQNMQHTK